MQVQPVLHSEIRFYLKTTKSRECGSVAELVPSTQEAWVPSQHCEKEKKTLASDLQLWLSPTSTRITPCLLAPPGPVSF